MQNRRRFLLTLTAAVVAMGFVVGSVIAEELFGVITKVDVDGKEVTIEKKDTDPVEEIKIKITDDTEYVVKKKSSKVDLEKLKENVEKAKDKGKKGIQVKVIHEKKVASKIYPQFGKGKKGAEKKDN
jgi:biopolymer transport protein ExbD